MRRDAPVHPKIAKASFAVELAFTLEGEWMQNTSDEIGRREIVHVTWLQFAVLNHTTTDEVIGWIEPPRLLKSLRRWLRVSSQTRGFELNDWGRKAKPILLQHVQKMYMAAGIPLGEVLWAARCDAENFVFDLDHTLEKVPVVESNSKHAGQKEWFDWCKVCNEPIEFSENQCRWKHRPMEGRTKAIDHVAMPMGW